MPRAIRSSLGAPLGPSALATIAVAAVILGSCGSGHTSAPSAASRIGPESIFEAEAQLHADPAKTLEVLARLGANRVKTYLSWDHVAPRSGARVRPAFDALNPAAYPRANWSTYDTIVRDASSRGIGLDLTVGGPAPLWASGVDSPGGPHREWKPSVSQFGAFMRAVATRYNGRYTPPGSAAPLPRVSFWSIWNEPNYGPDLAPQAVDHSTIEVSPRMYRDLLDAAWRALQTTGHGGDTILIGELAPRGVTTGDNPGNFSGMVPLRFIRALYCVDSSFRRLRATAAALRGCPTGEAASEAFPTAHPALFHAGGFADHPYPQGSVPPNVITPYEPDYADIAAIPNLERTLDRVQAAYKSNKRFPIYSTEFGYQTNPPEAISRATDPETAAYYMNWAEYISWRDPRVRSYAQYQLVDPTGANALGGFATGLESKHGAPKPTYDAYRLPLYLPATRTIRGRALEVWGCGRPTHYFALEARARQRVLIQFQPGSRGRFETLKAVTIANPYGYFDVQAAFPSSGSVRLAWSYPRGPTVHSRTVAVSVR